MASETRDGLTMILLSISKTPFRYSPREPEDSGSAKHDKAWNPLDDELTARWEGEMPAEYVDAVAEERHDDQ